MSEGDSCICIDCNYLLCNKQVHASAAYEQCCNIIVITDVKRKKLGFLCIATVVFYIVLVINNRDTFPHVHAGLHMKDTWCTC